MKFLVSVGLRSSEIYLRLSEEINENAHVIMQGVQMTLHFWRSQKLLRHDTGSGSSHITVTKSDIFRVETCIV